jgi:hypothetical protein
MKMKRELYAVFKYGEFVEAAWVAVNGLVDDSDRYLAEQERRLNRVGFSYKIGKEAVNALPDGYKARIFIPKISHGKKKRDFLAKFFVEKKHAEDDGVNYEKDEP